MSTLATELKTDPLGLGYAALLPDCPGSVVNLLNARNYSLAKSRFVTSRTVIQVYGMAGAAILDKLVAASASVSVVKWAMVFMSSDTGIDAGDPTTVSMLDALVVGGVLLQAECDQLKALALQPASRAEVLALGIVTEAQVRAALEA